MKHSIQLVIILGFIFLQHATAQYYTFEKTPEWVKPVDIPENSLISKYDILSGYYLTLGDYQVNLQENAIYNHEVINVVSYSGITNASQIAVSLDTSYQKLKIHHLYIWRKGKKIDQTSSLSFEMMNDETKLQQGIYTGLLSVYDILTDIRKDDLIDFSYTLVGKNPIFNNEKYLFAPIEAMNPVDLLSLRVLYNKDKDYAYKCVGCDSLVSVSEINNYKQIEIQNRNVKAVVLEDNIPTWIVPYKYFMISSFKSWADVNKWAQNVFALNGKINLDAVFNEIFTGQENTDEKINKIIDYVQDEIRYMGDESGIGSIKPLSPELVVKQRYGDCKDKSLLLVTLLKKIGIEEAYPALVNVDMQHELENFGPSNEVFNHCIVTFNYNGNSYWVDPAVPMQGGDFKDLYVENYGRALIIGMPADTLQLMPQGKTDAYADIVDEYTINSFTEPAKLKMTSNRYGFEADNRRLVLEYYSSAKILEMVEKDLKTQFPVVNKTSGLEVSDDMEKNRFSLTYNFEVNGFWQDGDKGTDEITKGLWIFRYEPMMLYDYFTTSVCEERKFDYEMSYPMNLNYKVIFHLPKDMLISDDYKSYNNEAFVYEEKLEQLSSNSFQIEYKLKIKSSCIKASDYKRICDQKEKIVKKMPLAIYFSK